MDCTTHSSLYSIFHFPLSLPSKSSLRRSHVVQQRLGRVLAKGRTGNMFNQIVDIGKEGTDEVKEHFTRTLHAFSFPDVPMG